MSSAPQSDPGSWLAYPPVMLQGHMKAGGAYAILVIAVACGADNQRAPAIQPAVHTAPATEPKPVERPTHPDAGPADASSDAPAQAPFDREAEIAWARTRWTKQLVPVHFGSLRDKLAAWVAPGAERRVWLTAKSYRCQPALLLRSKPDEGESSGSAALSLSILLQEKRVAGRPWRSTTGGAIEESIWFGSGGSTETQAPDGSWEVSSAWGVSEGETSARLSEVTDERAVFAGVPLSIDVECLTEALPCADGGSRVCINCSNPTLTIVDAGPSVFGLSQIPRSTCREPCPHQADSPDVDRGKRLFSNVEAWRIALPTDTATVATLFRSAAQCRRRTRAP